MIGWLIIIGMLGHERWAVREAATRICIEQGEVGRAIARAAMRSRDPEVRRRGERIEQEIVRATVGRCFPKGYPVWPCIDFLVGVAATEWWVRDLVASGRVWSVQSA
jgi:hypothetical protein